ncbi:MAG TPA: hypothetical protein VLD36_21765 [Burkholderiales bacterium]|jgi:hypothetical protein|nr:hypothetical protein [Burkholderiales bacterium]
MKLTMMSLLKIVWLIACVVMLAWTFVACGNEANATLRGECSLLAAIIMAFLTLPLGLLWWLLLSATGYVLSLVGIEIGSTSAIADFVVWFGFVVIGYFQWFKLVPWLTARWRSRRAARLQA